MQYKTLIATGLLAAGVVAETGKLGDAPVVTGNPQGKTYVAEFDGDVVKGALYFTATKSGKGVDVEVDIQSVTGHSGPFAYHLHAQPVAADGNCSSAKGHLDPYQRGMETPCDKTAPATCEVGDLSGKHGKIDALPYMQEYVELYASTKKGISAFLGNRSIVIHANDEKKTRIACTNLVLVEEEDDDSDDSDCETESPTYPQTEPAPGYPTGTPEKPCNGYDCPATTPAPGHAYPAPHGKPTYPEAPSHSSASPEHPESPVYPVYGKPEHPAHDAPYKPAKYVKPESPVYPAHNAPEQPSYPAVPSKQPEQPSYGPGKEYPGSAYPEQPAHSAPVYPSQPAASVYPVAPAPHYPGASDYPATTLVPVYPAATGYPAPSSYPVPSNETSPNVYPKPGPQAPEGPEQYTGSAATFGVSSLLAAVGAIAALVVVL